MKRKAEQKKTTRLKHLQDGYYEEAATGVVGQAQSPPPSVVESDEEQRVWMKNMRGWLMVVSTLVGSAAFLGGIGRVRSEKLQDMQHTRVGRAYLIAISLAFGFSMGTIIILLLKAAPDTLQIKTLLRILRAFIILAMCALGLAFSVASYGKLLWAYSFFAALLVFFLVVGTLTWCSNREFRLLRRLFTWNGATRHHVLPSAQANEHQYMGSSPGNVGFSHA
ncbi:hypothetical protein MUK42_16792 [Musa troglodytarum]|uniref:PGG domain-containing protein n=1 Tax=Musa troglodytarum TaxID=320322 RepID=A0A9E7HD41_9LILI|nr:hypothetical protein MUK42_16792 [Musa troglodytarum]